MIEVEHLSRAYGHVQALQDLSLHVDAGEIYGLVGPDGAGKTTAMRLIIGSIKAGAGRVVIDGHDMAHEAEVARASIGYLSQRFSLYEDLTVLENIRFFAEVRGLPAGEWKERARRILEFVGLAQFELRRAGQLSGGMKQKLGLATALVHRPKIILLDEPTTGVDPITRQDFWQLIIQLVVNEGVAVLISTPYMDEASRCTRVGFLHAGRLLTEGTPGELRAALQGRVIEVVGSPLPALRRLARNTPDVESVQLFGDRLHVRTRAGMGDAVMASLRERVTTDGATLAGMRAIPPQLEDVFMALAEAQP